MISRRDKLLRYPWQQQRYEQHRQKVHSAKAAIDVRTPLIYPHIINKAKKIQHEMERMQQIEKENVRLLQKLGDIMRTKRLTNFWMEPRPNFLNREKLFETRTHSTLPKLIAIYAPPPSVSDERAIKSAPPAAVKLKTPNSRCPTCCGRPERTQVRIPEKRIPWEPPRISWNIKTAEVHQIKKCLHCGHAKHS